MKKIVIFLLILLLCGCSQTVELLVISEKEILLNGKKCSIVDCFENEQNKVKLVFENSIKDLPQKEDAKLSMIVDAVCKDLNADGSDEIIMIAEYMTGAGDHGAIPFQYPTVMFQGSNDDFFTIPKLNEMVFEATYSTEEIETEDPYYEFGKIILTKVAVNDVLNFFED